MTNDHNQCASSCLDGLQVSQLNRPEHLDNNGAIPAQNGAGDVQYGVQQPGAPIEDEILVPGTPARAALFDSEDSGGRCGGSPDNGR